MQCFFFICCKLPIDEGRSRFVSEYFEQFMHSYFSGAYCNSPSACFVASDGQHLRLYQAVIDAKKLLCEQSNPEISVSEFCVKFLEVGISFNDNNYRLVRN